MAFELINGRLSLRGHRWELPVHPHWSVDPFEDPEWREEYQSLTWLAPLRRRALEGDDDARQAWWWLASAWLESLSRLQPGEATPWIGVRPMDRLAELIRGLAIVGTQGWLTRAISVHVTYLTHTLPPHGSLAAGEVLFVAGEALSSDELRQRARELLTTSCSEITRSISDTARLNLARVTKLRQDIQRIKQRLMNASVSVQGIEAAERALPELHEIALEQQSRLGYDIPLRPELGVLLDQNGWNTFRFGDRLELVEQQHSEWKIPRSPGSVTYSHGGITWIDDPGKYYYRPGTKRERSQRTYARNLLLPSKYTDLHCDDLVEIRRELQPGFLLLVLATLQEHTPSRYRGILLTARDGVVFLYDRCNSQSSGSRLTWHLGESVSSETSGNRRVLKSRGQTAHIEFFMVPDGTSQELHEQVELPGSDDNLTRGSDILDSVTCNVVDGEVGTVISPFPLHRRSAASRILRAMNEAIVTDAPIIIDDHDLVSLGSVARAKKNFSVDAQVAGRGQLLARCDHISAKYAFHLIRGKETVDKTTYRSENTVLFRNLTAGTYRIRVFAAAGGDRISALTPGLHIEEGA